MKTNFTGTIRSGLQGVYLNKYTDSSGKERDGIATMFAATEARSFFPCWDQPDVKCSFDLTVLVHRTENLQVLGLFRLTFKLIESKTIFINKLLSLQGQHCSKVTLRCVLRFTTAKATCLSQCLYVIAEIRPRYFRCLGHAVFLQSCF